MMKTDKKGLYVHIPICVRKCNYCDFCSFSGLSRDTVRRYVEMLCSEIISYKGKGIAVNTIFFGGGTPTLLSVDEMKMIFAAINEAFSVDTDAEITMEANPGTTSYEKLAGYIECGVNRFSVGLQTIHDNELKMLGRIHNFSDFLKTYSDMRGLGVKNINIDLMYGIPLQTMDSFKETLDMVAKLEPDHLSVYGLILEEGTPFYSISDSLPIPPEDIECDMYSLACDVLKRYGYRHYEISNYAKGGFESKHNKKYWESKEFIGVGVSAYSYLSGRRFGNTKDLQKYLSGEGFSEYCESLSLEDEKYEYAMLALRLDRGITLSEYQKLFSENFLSGRETVISKLSEGGYIRLDNDNLALTEKGFYVSNSIITELL